MSSQIESVAAVRNHAESDKCSDDEDSIEPLLDLDTHLEIQIIEDIQVKKFNTSFLGLKLKFTHLESVTDIFQLLIRSLETALERGLKHAGPGDKVGVEVFLPKPRERICVPFTTKNNLTAERILDAIGEESEEGVKLEHGLVLKTTVVKHPPTITIKPGGNGDKPLSGRVVKKNKKKSFL